MGGIKQCHRPIGRMPPSRSAVQCFVHAKGVHVVYRANASGLSSQAGGMRGTSLPPSRGYGATDPGPSASHEEEEEEDGHVAVARGGEQEEWSHALGRAEGEEEERLLGAWEDEDEEGRPVRRRKKKLSIVHATAGAMLLALFAIAAALLYFQRWVGRAGGQGAGWQGRTSCLPT